MGAALPPRCHPFTLRLANVLNKTGRVMPRCSSRPPDYDDRSWDSNAESWRTAGRFRSHKAKKAGGVGRGDAGFFKESRGWRWWSDDDDDAAELDQEEEEDDEVFEQDPWDAFWFFKVLKSFGWFLPPIIISTLIATGPKAFLVAMALPLGQSALSFAVDKLWGKPQTKQRNRASRAQRRSGRKKPFTRKASSYSNAEMEEEEVEDMKLRDDESWAAAGNVANEVEGSGRPEPSFGGWDELERGRRWAARRGVAGGSKRGLSRGGRRKKEVPLLMRLLIAVFPFLGSWTNLL